MKCSTELSQPFHGRFLRSLLDHQRLPSAGDIGADSLVPTSTTKVMVSSLSVMAGVPPQSMTSSNYAMSRCTMTRTNSCRLWKAKDHSKMSIWESSLCHWLVEISKAWTSKRWCNKVETSQSVHFSKIRKKMVNTKERWPRLSWKVPWMLEEWVQSTKMSWIRLERRSIKSWKPPVGQSHLELIWMIKKSNGDLELLLTTPLPIWSTWKARPRIIKKAL